MSQAAGASTITPGKDVSSVVDPIFFGSQIAICIFGFCISQTWTYLTRNEDGWILRSMVIFLFLMVFACTLLDVLMLHHYFVRNFGNIFEFSVIIPELSSFTLFTLIIVIVCDICFASRVWLSRFTSGLRSD
ncbi:hypothetical protein PM082_018663 [Marasmius tenuissimus]|nr:hypothetical protein PM082_018663 [Marasmius tenuissimus]